MSLRQFHLLFVSIVTCLFLGLGGWALVEYHQQESQGSILVWLGVASLATAVGVVIYGVWFLRKTRRLGLIE
ncbi:conserved protein of unknown function [Methylacidimicrobium sp. AP8]|uniref:hypothetical protein n=1 Tax=Methylacidimicrobium sp. AP8 TaxID=2730359 RepID=UPI0018BFDB17|nr:hypothetical protein [Methylacidimicrobium sp. AP8]CAB4244383.1 conserved protein of unknown function [Methylacidimicrobium sp. AP8]